MKFSVARSCLAGMVSGAGTRKWCDLHPGFGAEAAQTPRRRRTGLLELGVRPQLASNTAFSGLGLWYLARAKALAVGLPNAYFKSLGLPSLFEDC